MSELGDIYREMRKRSQRKRQQNLIYSATQIHDFCYKNKITVEVKNNGVHFIIKTDPVIDFWPSTGLWIVRDGQKKRGIKKLLKHLERNLKNGKMGTG